MNNNTKAGETPHSSPRETYAHLFTNGTLPSDGVLKSIIPNLSPSELNDLALELAKEELVTEGKNNFIKVRAQIDGENSSRRGFLGFVVNAGLAGFSLSRLMPLLTEEKAAKGKAEEKSDEPSYEGWAWKQSLGGTVREVSWEAFLGMLGTLSTNYLVGELGIRTGNASAIAHGFQKEPSRESLEQLLEKLEKDPTIPMRVFSQIAIKAPIVEEFLFRLAPALVMRLDSKNHWEVGIPTSVIFAAVHMLVPTELSKGGIPIPGTNITLDTTYLPLPQFMAGLMLWHINQKYGYIPAVAIHSAVNFFPAVISGGGIGGVSVALIKKHSAQLARLTMLNEQ